MGQSAGAGVLRDRHGALDDVGLRRAGVAVAEATKRVDERRLSGLVVAGKSKVERALN